MKEKHIYYFLLIVCFFMAVLGIGYDDDKAMLFGILGVISSGIHYLAEKIDEMSK